MKVTAFTRETLRCRRSRRALLAAGFEEIGENGGRLWQLYRGARQDHRIVAVVIAPEGKSLFVKIEPSRGTIDGVEPVLGEILEMKL